MKKDGFNISDAPEAFKRPETPPPAPPSVEPDEDLICPVCDGSGEGWTMSDSSPDAHMIQVDCGECSGSGSLHGAYQTVKAQRDSLATRLSDAGGQMLLMRTELESFKKELESHKRMLLAAACDIGAIGQALGADMDDDGSAIEGLAQEMRQDSDRLDFLESLARSSYTGASIVKGESKKSLEVMWFHKRAGAMPSLREAIDAAKEYGQ
ncbi:hypothetical protein ACSFEV_12030 [Pseudomonas fulva]|uniref:hypothetical protein n=1 Tax=Pseudomonas fulva TaxID=47880 RepID=UPI003EEF9CCB